MTIDFQRAKECAMRYGQHHGRHTLAVLAVMLVACFLIGNWRAHRETQSKLDALATALAVRTVEPVAPSVAQVPVVPTLQTPAEPKPFPSFQPSVIPAAGIVPRELDKITIPVSVIEAPDVLVIEALLRDPKTRQTDGLPVQPISGEFLVRPDGTVSLGVWGAVAVAGLTPEKAADAIRQKLTAFTKVNGAVATADSLVVSVDVSKHNSKTYYIITDGATGGEQVVHLPLTGNETVLDALAAIPGLAAQADKRTIRVVRQGPAGAPHQILPVDWTAIAGRGDTTTNYALMPGDRVYVTGSR